MRREAVSFQSTRPVKGATRASIDAWRGRLVSIHAPREGRDTSNAKQVKRALKFQSTRPVKGATERSTL